MKRYKKFCNAHYLRIPELTGEESIVPTRKCEVCAFAKKMSKVSEADQKAMLEQLVSDGKVKKFKDEKTGEWKYYVPDDGER